MPIITAAQEAEAGGSRVQSQPQKFSKVLKQLSETLYLNKIFQKGCRSGLLVKHWVQTWYHEKKR